MSELREAIARAIGTYLEGKNFSVFGGTEAVLSADDFCLPIDTLEVADAALAAIEARGMVVVPKEPTGFFATLTPEQQKAALAYDGQDTMMPPLYGDGVHDDTPGIQARTNAAARTED